MTEDTNKKQSIWQRKYRNIAIGVGILIAICTVVVGVLVVNKGEVAKPAMTINGDAVSMQRYNHLKKMAIDNGVAEDEAKQKVVSILVHEHVMKKNDIVISDADITSHLLQQRLDKQGAQGIGAEYTEKDGSVINTNPIPTAADASEWEKLEAKADLLKGQVRLRAMGGKQVTILDYPYENKLFTTDEIVEDARKYAEKRAKEAHGRVSKDPKLAFEEADTLVEDTELRYGGTSNRSQTIFTDGKEAAYTAASNGDPTEYIAPDILSAIAAQDKPGVGDIITREYDVDGSKVAYGYLFVVVHSVIKADTNYPEKIQDQIDGARVVLYV